MELNLKRVRAERTAKGFTQDQMAEKMGFKSRAAYAKRENGIVSMGADELGKIADILNIKHKNIGIFFTLDVPDRERVE